MHSSYRQRPFLGLVVAALLAAAGCGGAVGSAPAATGGQSSPSAVGTPADASPAASPEASGAGALPEACVAQIREHLIAIEPIVSGVDWRVATEVPPQIAEQLDAEAFDPEACPDVSATEAHAAWIAIATDAAPGTLDYIDFIYRP